MIHYDICHRIKILTHNTELQKMVITAKLQRQIRIAGFIHEILKYGSSNYCLHTRQKHK